MAKPTRTTVSLPLPLSEQFHAVCKHRSLSTSAGFRAAVEHFVQLFGADHRQKSGAQKMAHEVLESTQFFSNPYQQTMALWRLARTQGQLDSIGSFRLELDAWSADIYLMKVLSELLKDFDERDSFFTITNLAFWRGAGPGGHLLNEPGSQSDHEFYLQAQKAAVSKGLRIHRIFLIDREDRDGIEAHLAPHLKFQEELEEHYKGKVTVSFLANGRLQDLIRRFGHFAYVRRRLESQAGTVSSAEDAGTLIVEPAYDPMAVIRSLRFIFSRGSGNEDPITSYYLDRFQQAASMSTPIQKIHEWLGDLNNEPRRAE